MNSIFSFLSVAVFSIFLGSQIVEGTLLVPYWKSLPAADFYKYFAGFGSKIGAFYSALTILAVLFPIGTSIYFYVQNAPGFKFAFLSAVFACLVIAMFYLYFKGANQHFFEGNLEAQALKAELLRWEKLHWLRVLLQGIALVFLALAFRAVGGAGEG